MSDEKDYFQGTIHKNFIKKIAVKTLTGLIGILVPVTLFACLMGWVIVTDEGTTTITNPAMFYFWISFFFGILPGTIIFTGTILYYVIYVKKFSYKITEDHVVITHGVFTQTRATIPYSRIQNINIVNGVFDRIFDTFTVKVETAGSSAAAASAQSGVVRPEGYIPGIKDPHIVERKIKEMMTRYSQVPSGLEDKIFKPEELAFDNFISYILSKMREGEALTTSIKELRENKSLTTSQLAEKVGVPVQTINYLEEGKYNPSLTLAYKIAEVLECNIEDLFKIQ